MASLNQAEAPPNNTAETRRPNAGQFEPGNKLGAHSGGGRRKGLERRVRERVEIGDDINLLVEVMLQHASGWRCLIHPTEKDPKTKSGMVEVWQEVSVSDQREAVKWLADRGYGKAREFVTVEIEDPAAVEADADAFGDALQHRLDELAERRKRHLLEAEAAAAQ